MIELSLSEISSLSTKAARGAGYSWGMAQEAGFAAKWLSQHGVNGAQCVARLLDQLGGKPLHEHVPQFSDDAISCPPDGTCSLALGCLISDLPHLITGRDPVPFPMVIQPALLLPYLAHLGEGATEFALSMNGVEIRADGSSFDQALFDNGIPPMSDIAINGVPAGRRKPVEMPPQVRPGISQSVLDKLERFARLTYVPESKLSRERGAGGTS